VGLNVIIACHRHRAKTYMMRGEEPLDLQTWMRGRHGKCFEVGKVAIYRDCDFYPEEYADEWQYEQRPKALAGVAVDVSEQEPHE
jgi:hypothetical protein